MGILDLDRQRLGKESYFILLSLLLAFGALETLGGITGTERPVVTVISCSMYPEYSIGDVVFVKGASIDSLEEGDVIVFSRGNDREGTPIIHRVIEVEENHVGTQGDNSDRQLPYEEEISEERIYGKAVFRIPLVGYVNLLGHDLAGYGEPNIGPGANTPLSLDNQYFCREG